MLTVTIKIRELVLAKQVKFITVTMNEGPRGPQLAKLSTGARKEGLEGP